MGLDLQNTIDDIKNKVSALNTVRQTLDDAEKRKKQVKDNSEQLKDKVLESLDKAQQEKKRIKREVKSQLENLLDIFKSNSGSGSSSISYVKTKFIQILNRMQPLLEKLIKETMVDCVGCTQEQTYDANTPIYVRLRSIDLASEIKNFKPDVEEGAVLYEPKATVNGEYPFAMNREIWNRTQKLDQLFSAENQGVSFLGKSTQQLFDFKYVQQNPLTGEEDDFLEIILKNRANNANNVTTFLYDYYSSINIVDLNGVYARLVEILFGALSIGASLGYEQVEIKNKIALIIQRILGLCFDSKDEIDVSGVSKVAELDGIDDSFFDFTSLDLRKIEQKTTNTVNGVVEYEDCDNIKLPVDPKPFIKILNEMRFNDGKISQIDKLADLISKAAVNNPNWKLRIPNTFNIELKIDTEFLLTLPLSIVMSILSPKILLPIFIMFYALKNEVVDLIENAIDFIKRFKKCFIKLISKIGAVFVRELFLLIKRDLLQLLNGLVRKISQQKIAKKYVLIAKLVAILAILVKAFIDWRKCKSVLDEILAILNVIFLGRGGLSVPISPLLLAVAGSLPGYSSIRSLSNIIEEYQKLGLPTGPTPSGRPNLALLAKKGELDGEDLERLNQKGAILIPPLSITPAGQTVPTTQSLIPNLP